MARQSLSRNAQVLRYLLGEAPRTGHTKLLKFAYLSDLVARQYLGRPISEFRYRRYDYGPFDSAFYAAKEELLTGGFATSTPTAIGAYEAQLMAPTDKPVEYAFSVAEAAVLNYVAETYLHHGAAQLCEEVVYRTEPMQGVKMNEELPMDNVNNRPGDPLDFNVERMLAGEASGREGRTRPLGDVLRELRARNH